MAQKDASPKQKIAKSPAKARGTIASESFRDAQLSDVGDIDIGEEYGSDRKFVWALARGFQILRAFKPGQGALGNGELAIATGLPKATVTRLTYTLSELGYLQHVKHIGKYEPAPRILALGYPVLANMSIRQTTQGFMQELAQYSNATVALAARDLSNMIYVNAYRANEAATLRLDVGSRVSMSTSSVGRAYLASIPEDEREHYFTTLSVHHGDNWPTVKEHIFEAIEDVHKRGFCIVDGEWGYGVRAAAAPLILRDGTVMAMSCGAAAFVLDRERLENDLGPRLAHYCAMQGR